MKEKVGFMGLGIMGAAMAANIARAGYPLATYNRTPGRAAHLESFGVETAPSPRALAQTSDVLIAMVTGPEAVAELLWGREGAMEALDGDKVFINMSTVSAAFAKELARKMSASGIPFIDAPVSGSKKPAEDGALLILAGGDPELVRKHTPLLETMGKKVVRCGEAGQGTMMKLMNNLLLGILMEGLAESFHFGKTAGLPVDAMLQVILDGPLGCPLFEGKIKMFLDEDFPPNFPLKHMTKDLKFVIDAAYDDGIPVPAGNLLLHVFRTGVGRKWGDMDVGAVYKVLQYLNRCR